MLFWLCFIVLIVGIGLITVGNILEEVLQDDECFSLKDLAVNGKDVMDTMLIKSGKEVGYWLNEILTRVIDGRLKNDREDLIYWMTGITDGWIKY